MNIPILHDIDSLRNHSQSFRKQGQTLGLVPTMGALHQGHLSLVQQSIAENDHTLVTIFVNPTQFAPGEDLSEYPRTMEADLDQLASLASSDQVSVFAPSDVQIYPADFSTKVIAPTIGKRLEGEFRPAHFGGVVTVVLKLFNLSQADVAYFGQKDYQQVAVIRQMVKDLNVPIRIETCPIIRDQDGLALSSRNAYLSDEERKIALTLNQTLAAIETLIRDGLRDGFEIITEMRQMLIDGGVDSIDYAIIADPDTLETSDPIQLPAVALVAAYVGKTRLIDNRLIDERP